MLKNAVDICRLALEELPLERVAARLGPDTALSGAALTCLALVNFGGDKMLLREAICQATVQPLRY